MMPLHGQSKQALLQLHDRQQRNPNTQPTARYRPVQRVAGFFFFCKILRPAVTTGNTTATMPTENIQ